LKVGILYSGGKDSTYAAYIAKQQGHEISCLITMMPESSESYLFHYPNISWTDLQSQALGVPIVKTKIKNVGESEVLELAKAIKKAKEKHFFEGIVTGGLASRYQKDRIEAVCSDAGLQALSPSWMMDPEKYMLNIIKSGFKVMIVGVAAEGLDINWLGRIITEEMIDELKKLKSCFDININFEGGEAETYTLDAPIFRKRIEVQKMEKHWFNYYGFLEIKAAKLVGKALTTQKS
jgi:ABC transporter with metal-binding/Fe-S-binding domain ATP-binding protein|tara:strand:- start:4752 stop:5456 length:705 start_codon:yes stop_codon:yes gene_type:complete